MLVATFALLSATLLLVVGCSLAASGGGTPGGTGSGSTGANPSFTPPPAPSPVKQVSFSGPAQAAAGAPAITPQQNGVPAFSADDMATYVEAHPLPDNFGGGSPTIVQKTFLTAAAISQLLNLSPGALGVATQSSALRAETSSSAEQSTNPADTQLFGLVVLQGSFAFPGAPSSSAQQASPYAYEIFDAQTGNLLMWGGLAQPPGTQPTPTATPVSHPPTKTPAPQCTLLVRGSGVMNVDKVYLDVDSTSSATNPGNLSTNADVHWSTSPAPGTMQPVAGALIADEGAIGSTGFNNLTCAQIKGAHYGSGSVAATAGEVFLVKTSAGHFAKVLLSAGASGLTVGWQTYS